MANGHSATLLSLPQPSSAPADPRAQDKLGDSCGIEIEIGEAVASAVIVIRGAVEDTLRTGVFDSALKVEGGNRLARVATLQLDHELGDDDFIDKARRAGRRVLRRYNRELTDAVIDVWIGDMFAVVSRVVHDERIYRVAWAN